MTRSRARRALKSVLAARRNLPPKNDRRQIADFDISICDPAGPMVMVVNPSVPTQTVPEFIAYAKDNPGKVAMASAGTGSGPDVAGELFKVMTGINMLHVPYRGDAPALSDLLGGQVQLYFSTLPGSIAYIRAGKLRALAVTSATRSEALPDIPSVGEFVPGYEASQWAIRSITQGLKH